ncbi:hypothetical protein PAXINDRAFT_157834 [Paxillus involutus ATCC 200175]|uniref:Uncharacterized protein n=1 Tax=Paxillus involutus ATCC 200175 TaxID=664439 RepID=A0A0C9T1Y6_PAXIN|nr:hypothetical protein PAXINDRAFT_157834 [Paxillus involutus ATCC 200175]
MQTGHCLVVVLTSYNTFSMGRKCKYHTDEERREATRLSCAKYYTLHRDVISQKMKMKYCARHSSSTQSESKPSKLADTLLVDTPLSERGYCGTEQFVATLARSLKPTEPNSVQIVEHMLHNLVQGSSKAYMEHIYLQVIDSADNDKYLQPLKRSLQAAESIEFHAQQAEADVLQKEGIGPCFRQAEQISRQVQNLIRHLEDIYGHVMGGASDLAMEYNRGTLMYQTSADIFSD